MDRVKAAKQHGVERGGGIEQAVIQLEEVYALEDRPSASHRLRPGRSNGTNDIEACRGARDPTRLPPQIAPECGRVPLTHHQLHEGGRVEIHRH